MSENTPRRTEISELGEFGLIEEVRRSVTIYHPEDTIKGIGDDAAVLDTKGKMAVTSTDMLVEGVHFDLSFHPLRHLGYKSIVVNLSDLFAMNAQPKQVLVSIALSNRFSLEAFEELYAGMQAACRNYQVDLAGGDTTSSRSGLVLSITAIGVADKEEIIYRNTAKEKDLLCVSGDLGGAYLGLQILEREKKIFMENPGIQPDLSGNDYILERQLKPEARRDIIQKLRELGVKPTAMIDLSDGLASEIFHIARQSGLGCELYESKIPIHQQTYERAREFGLDPTVCALSGGEDYELLFTIRPDDYEKIREHLDVSIVGHMTDASMGINMVTKSSGSIPLKAQGWDALLGK